MSALDTLMNNTLPPDQQRAEAVKILKEHEERGCDFPSKLRIDVDGKEVWGYDNTAMQTFCMAIIMADDETLQRTGSMDLDEMMEFFVFANAPSPPKLTWGDFFKFLYPEE